MVNGGLSAEILRYPLVFELPLRTTEQHEWSPFAPLAFLLVQSRRPQRILEVGTVVGDSYLTFCQAVQRCHLAGTCRCVPSFRGIHENQRFSSRFDEFRAYHDREYGKFSRIQLDGAGPDVGPRLYKLGFDLIHIVSPKSAVDLDLFCETWLPELDPSGVALVSGLDQGEEGALEKALNKWARRYHSRILRLNHTVAIFSKQPLGLVRSLLFSGQSEFDAAVKLLGILGDRATLYAESLQSKKADLLKTEQLASFRSDRDKLAEQLASFRSDRDKLAEQLASLGCERHALAQRVAEIEDSEVGAQIRFGQSQLLLASMGLENSELRQQLSTPTMVSEVTIAQPSPQQTSTVLGESVPEDRAKGLLLQLCDKYCDTLPPTELSGKEFWQQCGQAILSSVLDRQIQLRFARPETPKLSVVIVLRNKASLSALSLGALLLDSTDYELILIDNASMDETSSLLSLLQGATIIRNVDNRGFGAAVMQAASIASGEYVCLLNNDALLEPGTLRTTLNTFVERPNTGVVGGKVLLADGRLQEAGCILWRDGRTHQYGRGDDPGLPQYNFRRAVDYCSGAFLVTPRSLFLELGGLDDRYGIGYYEDIDYCMKTWHAHKSVLFDPRAVIHHYEGASSASQSSVLQLVIRNHEHFTARWRSSLRFQQVERPENILLARTPALAGGQRCLYFIDHSGLPVLQAESLKIERAGDTLDALTCIYIGDDDFAVDREQIGVDVELLTIDEMSGEEVAAYCDTCDIIVIAAEAPSANKTCLIASQYSAKIRRD
jgi:O-antigen biosynthesis protein